MSATRRVLLPALALWLLGVGVSLRWNLRTERERLDEAAREVGRAVVDEWTATWNWTRAVGGVWVDPEGLATPVQPDVEEAVLADGRALVRLDAPLVAADRAARGSGWGAATARIVSDRPVNLDDLADAWETAALARMRRGATEAVRLAEDEWGRPVVRYAAPLRVEAACLSCHPGERVGDVRGLVSVRVPADSIVAASAAHRRDVLGLHAALAILGGLLVVVIARARRSVEDLLRRHARELEARNRVLARAADTDPLTGLPNRRAAFRRLAELVRHPARRGRPMAFVLFDLDGFKAINDTHGHAAGDAVLRVTARLLRAACRPEDVVARVGGEEFLLVALGCGRAEGTAIAERVREGLAGSAVILPGGRAVRPTLSAGVAVLGGQDEDVDAALRQADEALYAAKDGGRDRVEVHGGGCGVAEEICALRGEACRYCPAGDLQPLPSAPGAVAEA